jgi:hypothetical protein
MIKLIDLLKEIQDEKVLDSKEQDVVDDILGSLQEGMFDDVLEKVKNYAKKGLITASVLAALMAAPSLSSAQKSQISNIAKTEMSSNVSTTKTNPSFWVKDTNDIKKIQDIFKIYRAWTLNLWKNDKATIIDSTKFYSKMTPAERENIESRYMTNSNKTDVDGLNGQYTSSFIFPSAFLRDLDAGTVTNLGLKGNESLNDLLKKAKGTISITDLNQWNDFVKWMKTKGYSGKTDMNQANFSNKVLQQYKGK